MQRTRLPATMPVNPVNPGLQQRIADLERENAELRAQMRILKELIGGRPTTQPF